jgi:hypothetical protein
MHGTLSNRADVENVYKILDEKSMEKSLRGCRRR